MLQERYNQKKIKEDKAKKILVEGFDIKPSLATEIWNKI